MKMFRSTLPVILLLSAAFAQNATQHHAAQPDAKKIAPPKSEAQQAFEQLKKLEGSWVGQVTTTPPTPDLQGKDMNVVLRTTSMGNALLHEMTGGGRPDDPITMMYMDEGRLLLTHYCDAGNRPRMTAKLSPDGKTVAFDFLDIAGNTKYGHMQNAAFTKIDDDHHIEEWTFMVAGKDGLTPVRAHFDLRRKN